MILIWGLVLFISSFLIATACKGYHIWEDLAVYGQLIGALLIIVGIGGAVVSIFS